MRRNGGEEFATRVEESLFNLGEFHGQHRDAGGEDEIGAGREKRLVPTIEGAEATLGAIAFDGATDGGARSDHSEAGRSVGGFRRTKAKRKKKSAAVDAAALFPDGAKIVVAPQALPGAQAHRGQTTVRRLRPLRRRLASTLRPPRVALRAR